MAIITNPGIALALVRAEQRRRGDYSALTAAQIRAIRRVVRRDQRGRLSRDECVTRLRSIGSPDEAA
jgi:hypothetical protein